MLVNFAFQMKLEFQTQLILWISSLVIGLAHLVLIIRRIKKSNLSKKEQNNLIALSIVFPPYILYMIWIETDDDFWREIDN